MGLFDWFRGKNIKVERNRQGEWSYWLGGDSDFSLPNKLKLSLTNPALFTAFNMRSTMLSRGIVKVQTLEGEDLEKDKFLDLIANPNYCESTEDFIKKHSWFKALGTGITKVVPNRPNGNVRNIENVAALEHLIPSQVDYGETSKYTNFITSRSQKKAVEERTLRYKISGEEHKIPVSELAFFYDIACNMRDEGLFKSPSRIDALAPEIKNIQEAQSSKNKNLVFSAKWLATNKKKGLQGMEVNLEENERTEIETSLFNKSMNATNANVDVENLANDFRKLMLDDNISSDAMRIFSVYDIPRSVLNWWAKGQAGLGDSGSSEEIAAVRWIQNSIQLDADDFCNTWSNFFNYREQGKKIVMDFSHLPVMQVLETKRMEGIERQAKILDALIKAQMPLADALRISGLDETEA